ncbi:MAG TPA: polysaccharide deacetylase family protein [Roseiarcus sp.]|nr:polysaccharide deacetylase family protein [Roseiarcus sp.]
MILRPSLALAAAIIMAPIAPAAACEPGALGTARIMPVGTEGGLQVGLKSYPRTLPLQDHEVVLTFDDGPEPGTTAKILDALASQCVRATFFVIGRKVEQSPDLARREVAEGHTVAYHTYSHPQPTMRAMSAGAARADVARGIAAVETLAYGEEIGGPPDDVSALRLHAPFFRFPGFAETPDLRRSLAASNIAIFGTDLWAADWIKMTPQRELRVIMSALDRAGRGMILLHDDKPWTAAMLPDFLRALKAKGYRVVHIVAGQGRGETAPAPKGWKAEAPP